MSVFMCAQMTSKQCIASVLRCADTILVGLLRAICWFVSLIVGFGRNVIAVLMISYATLFGADADLTTNF